MGRQDAADRGRVGIAAQGGLRRPSTRGNELKPDGKLMANFWQGEFPWQNLVRMGSKARRRWIVSAEWAWARRYDRQRGSGRPIGTPRSGSEPMKACCAPHNPRGGKKRTVTIPASRRFEFRGR